MLHKINTKKKLLLFPTIFIIIIVLVGNIYTHYSNIANTRNGVAIKTEIFIQEVLKGRISVYQFLRNPSQEAALKVKEDFKLLQNDVESFKTTLSSEKNIKLSDEIIHLSKEYVNYFDNFAQTRIANFQNGILQETSDVLEKISQMVKIGLELENKLDEINISAIKLKEESNEFLNNLLITISIIAILLFLIFSLYISKVIIDSLDRFKDGLLSFFAFLNKESSNVELINLDGKDEFGQMAKVVNENIKKSNEILLNEEQVLEQIEKMIQNIERGFFMYRIKLKCENQQIETIRNNINSLANNLQMKISSISNVLLDFGESHFESRVPEDLDMVGTYGSLKSSTRLVGNNVSELLAMILTTGDKLNEDTTILSASSQNLSINANEAASSLEETAASLEEITSNIRNNTQSIAKMSALSFNVTKSVKEGEELANQTTTAMDEINTQVNLVNEAISVIDNIAFQTNILSLNAAVEAATAGEAGKGFAVVAQEVRNLASRSAEAAKEIKDIVELATKKANEGKEIANSMIEGYKDLNSNVSQTVTLISDIEMASKEQLLGIEQINDAVNNLDAQTQQNAMVSNQINDLSREVSELSSKLVSAANLADYSKKTKDYICNVDLVFKTAKLKNDHIRFKENNFAKLGNNERWTVVSCNDCNLGKWIKESEQNQEKYTKTQSWNKLKDYHADLHNSVQKYIDEDVEVNSKVNLKDLAIDIEILTSHIFDELNMVKKNVCLEKPEIS